MSNFIGNLLLTSVICSVVIGFTFLISPLFKRYTKVWRYVVFILVAVKLLIPMPLYTANNALVIPIISDNNILEKNESNEINDSNNVANVDIDKVMGVGKDDTTDSNKISESYNTSDLNDSSDRNNTLDTNNSLNMNNTSDANNAVIADKSDVSDINTKNATDANNTVNKDNEADINTKNAVTDNEQKIQAEADNAKVENMKNTDTLDINAVNALSILLCIWLAGAIIFSGYYILMYFYHRKTINRWSTKITDEKALAMLKEEKEALGITKNIALMKCKNINTPMTLGFIHLSIILPYAEYNEESIRYILKHELTHQKRHDIYAKVLFVATKCIHWFNPIVPIMVNRAYDDMEILCDDMVVADLQKEQRIEYNETILNIARMKAEEITGKNILFAFCFIEKESNLEERMKNIMVMGKRRKGYQIVALAMALIVSGSCFISCGTKENNKNKTATETPTEAPTEVSTEEIVVEVSEIVSVKPSLCESMNVPYAYKEALEGRADIICGNQSLKIEDYINGEKMIIENKSGLYNRNGINILNNINTYINAYHLIDLDVDGIDEVILELSGIYTSYAVLHYVDGVVYGYDKICDTRFKEIKKDGTYFVDHYDGPKIVKINLDKDSLTQTVLAETFFDVDTMKDKYFVENVKCDKKTFEKYCGDFSSKEEAKINKVVTPILSVNMNQDGMMGVCNQSGMWEGIYTFDFNKDGQPEKLEVKCDMGEENTIYKYKYNILIDDKKMLEISGETVNVWIIDIDSRDSEYELVINSEVNDDKIYYGIYRVAEDELVNLNENIDDNHMYLFTEGDGMLRIEYDTYNSDVGCFYMVDNYQYKDGKLVEVTKNNIYELENNSAENVYKLYRNIKVYKNFDLKEEVTTLKKGSTLKIARIHSNGYIERYGYEEVYYDAAEVVVDGKVVGWIELPTEEHQWGEGLFTGDTIPSWD